jgi:DNA-directed RNA polymerase specialized sigma24 family protein
LSPTAWSALLARLGDDVDAAGREYERLRGRLVRFLEWHRCLPAEDLADVVLTRLANKCDVSEPITNIHAYAIGIARFVIQEAHARRPIASLDADGIPPPATAAVPPDEDGERRAACLDNCLERLPRPSRELVLRYYEGEGQAKIAQRRALAASLDITDRALRLRIFRLRDTLQECVQGCVSDQQRVQRAARTRPVAHS